MKQKSITPRRLGAFVLRLIVCVPFAAALIPPLSASAAQTLRGRDLRFDDPPVREHLARHLPGEVKTQPGPRDLEALGELIDKGSAKDAERAAWILGDWPGEDNAELLLKALRHPSASVRARAAASSPRLLGHMTDRQRRKLIDALVQAAEDDIFPVETEAVRALGYLHAKDQLPLIKKCARSQKPELAAAALETLSRFDSAQNAADIVASRIGDDDIRVAKTAIAAAAHFNSPAVVSALTEVLESPYAAVRCGALRALGQLESRESAAMITSLLNDPLGSVRREALPAIEALGMADEYVTEIEKALGDQDPAVRTAAAEIAEKNRMTGLIPNLFELLGDRHYYARQHAAEALVTLAEWERDRITELTAGGLTSDRDNTRAKSSFVLGKLRSERSLENHIRLLNDHFTPARRWAAWALGEIGNDAATPALTEAAFPKDPDRADTDVRSSAILALGKLGHEGISDRLAAIIPQKPTMTSDGQPTLLRRASIRALGYMEDRDRAALLRRRLNDGPDGEMPDISQIRKEAAVALARMDAEGEVETLRKHMGDRRNSMEIRSACRWAIHRLTGEWPDLELEPTKRRPPEYFIRALGETE